MSCERRSKSPACRLRNAQPLKPENAARMEHQRDPIPMRARSLDPLVKTRAFGMTPLWNGGCGLWIGHAVLIVLSGKPISYGRFERIDVYIL
jgi:hypothetical protein